MAYGDLKDLTRKELLIKRCVIRHLMLLKMVNTMDVKEVLLQYFIRFLIKNTAFGGVKNKNISEELNKAIIRKF